MQDILEIGGRKIKNRLLMGTGKFSDHKFIKQIIEQTGIEIVTVALRRVDTTSKDDNILDFIPKSCVVMANTSGARNADEAIRIARLAKAGGMGNWIKIEVISDTKYLLPDNQETIKATEVLSKEGFVVLAYMSPDLIAAKKLSEVGAAAIMPLGAPIGSNRGFKTKELVKIMVEEINKPIIVDAGIGRPSEACECMEIGCAAVLINTAIAISSNPVDMAYAFNQAVAAGRMSYLAGIGNSSNNARASSPLTGFLRKDN